MDRLPPITERERWFYEKVAPIAWVLLWPLLGIIAFVPFYKTLNYLWLILPPTVGILFLYCSKKLTQYAFLYKARMTKTDWKKLEDETRDNYKDGFEDSMVIIASLAMLPIGLVIYMLCSR